jgi:hypothetical protein
MKKTKITVRFRMALTVCLTMAVLAGCQAKEPSGSSQTTLPSESTSASTSTDTSTSTAPSSGGDTSTGADSSTEGDSFAEGGYTDEGGLYLFLGGEDYTCYPAQADSTPEDLVAGIEDLTGWNLSLADEITTGKGGITVSFATDSCLFVGPPEEQKEEFFVYDNAQLTFAVLDSVQKTLQCWASPVNPDSVDIYFCMAGDVPLELDNLGITWPMEQPYSHQGLEELLASAVS